ERLALWLAVHGRRRARGQARALGIVTATAHRSAPQLVVDDDRQAREFVAIEPALGGLEFADLLHLDARERPDARSLWLLFELAGAGQERLAVGLLEQDPALDVRAGERERLLECVIDPLL